MAWARPAILFWLGAAALSLVVCSNGLREDELECEQAVSHLVDCCSEFPASAVNCEYSDEGCSVIPTGFSIEESHCIEQESCESLRSDGLCDRIARLAVDGGLEPTDAEPAPSVCP
jgi:hypothetical protein